MDVSRIWQGVRRYLTAFRRLWLYYVKSILNKKCPYINCPYIWLLWRWVVAERCCGFNSPGCNCPSQRSMALPSMRDPLCDDKLGRRGAVTSFCVTPTRRYRGFIQGHLIDQIIGILEGTLNQIRDISNIRGPGPKNALACAKLTRCWETHASGTHYI